MKKVLMVLGLVFLCLIGGCTLLLIWAQRSGSAHQQKFFAAVLSGDPKKVMALCHPAMKDEVDEPVLGAWMAVVKADLGKFKGLSKADFNTSSDYKNGQWITESKGTVNFEKGQAQAELRFINGKIVSFNVKSDKIPVAWFKGPVGTELYRERGKEFLTKLLGGQVEDAFKMMHENLQKEIPLDKLQPAVAKTVEKVGKVKSVTFESESMDPAREYRLDILYKIECDKAPVKGGVQFQFVGLKMSLLAFRAEP